MKKILYTTEFGSKLYGTTTPSSDTDYKSIYLPDLDDVLTVRPINVHNLKTNDQFGQKNGAEDVDHEMIPFQKFARDFIEGQTYAVEIAFSVLSFNHSAKQVHDPRFTEFIRTALARYLNDNLKPMVRYAQAQAHVYGDKGARLASLNKFKDKLVTTIDSGVDVTTKLAVLEDWVTENTDEFIRMKTVEGSPTQVPQLCVDVTGKMFPVNIDLQEALSRINTMISKYGARSQKSAKDGGVDWKAFHHACRIALQACDLLTNGSIMFPYKQDRLEYLMKIKLGQMEFDTVVDNLSEILDRIQTLHEGENKLRRYTPELREEYEAFLESTVRNLYGVDQK